MAAKYRVVGKPTPTKDTVDVIEGLGRKYDEMTQSQKRVAQYIVENADTVAFSTVDQMASKLGVNPSTIVRFTYRLGLKGFPDLQARIQELADWDSPRRMNWTND